MEHRSVDRHASPFVNAILERNDGGMTALLGHDGWDLPHEAFERATLFVEPTPPEPLAAATRHRELLFTLLVSLRNAIVTDGSVLIVGHASEDFADLALLAGFSRIIMIPPTTIELRR